MKSIINSEQVKKLVAEAVEKALIECATQHEANAEAYMGNDCKTYQPSEDMLKFANTPPEKLKLTFNFYWSKEDASKGQPTEMFCQPVIDLTGIKND
jgi:hypothetical protein